MCASEQTTDPVSVIVAFVLVTLPIQLLLGGSGAFEEHSCCMLADEWRKHILKEKVMAGALTLVVLVLLIVFLVNRV